MSGAEGVEAAAARFVELMGRPFEDARQELEREKLRRLFGSKPPARPPAEQ
ncbi:hypothetical protein SEA_MARSHAWN_87 [Mycobacterium phage Marshawn]|uniref:Uncharacterized protein n=1 Tax=Mycobacterium phage Marshawn TaxID=2652423 RepID=A0A5P8D766_9CAUD|nr:hypothetical protein I5H02_gp12 [Mycobacterium phage Marshawn]QFP94873.1 hypothetical protein SEA_MARSHAWN_87 [Mycobacterium phage Marshawn]